METCTACAGAAGYECGTCGAPYCGPACQRADWACHSASAGGNPNASSVVTDSAEPIGALFGSKRARQSALLQAAAGLVAAASATNKCDVWRLKNSVLFSGGGGGSSRDAAALQQIAFLISPSTPSARPRSAEIKEAAAYMDTALRSPAGNLDVILKRLIDAWNASATSFKELEGFVAALRAGVWSTPLNTLSHPLQWLAKQPCRAGACPPPPPGCNA